MTFDGDAFTGPLLLEGGEAFPLPDADDVLLEVELLGVEAQQAQPQLAHRLRVGLAAGEALTLCGGKNKKLTQTLNPEREKTSRRKTHQLHEVVEEEGVPAVHHPLRDRRPVEDLQKTEHYKTL